MANDLDDPFAPPGGTILRPRPGLRRAAEPRADASRVPPTRLSQEAVTLSGSAGKDFVAGGKNPILSAAGPLIAIAARMQTLVTQADIAALRSQAMQEIRLFDDRLRAADVVPEDALVARYILCTFFDSAVLNTPWGAHSDWSGQSLLVTFHREKSGGEKFFQILERIAAQPARYVDLIELQYVCLTLGYEGMYRLEPRGEVRLAELQHELFRHIRGARQLRDEELSPQWRGVGDRRKRLFRYLPWWIIATSACAILTVAFAVYSLRLNAMAAPIKTALLQPAIPYEAPIARVSTLKELLQPQELAGQLTVEEFAEQTVVTLVGADFFRSGSTDVSSRYVDTLQAIAAALNQVPGAVTIVGHTDDVPIRSLQFADNFELSRERALAVANLLKPWMHEFGRVEWIGVGDTQPRYRPVNTAENRARNRRVEIVNASAERVQ